MQQDNPTNFSIKQWAEEDRPREKLLLKGKDVLSDAELIAILIGTGTKKESAVDLAKKILNTYKNDLNELGKLSVKDLTEIKGIGEAKAITILAALELGRRRQISEIKEKLQFKSSKDAVNYFQPRIASLPHEEFHVLMLNNAKRLVAEERLSVGGISTAVADRRIIFNMALKNLATSILLVHNHPSGNPKPSQHDIELTRSVKEAGRLLQIELVDHIIVSENGFYSFADEGQL